MNYLIYTKKIDAYCTIDYNELKGYTFKPLNKYELDNIKISKFVLIRPELVTKVLKRKIKNKLSIYLNLIISMFDEDDEWCDPTNLRHALNSLERFKRMIINKYRIYLEEKYYKLLLTKLAMLEKEIKDRIVYLEKDLELEQEVNKRSR